MFSILSENRNCQRRTAIDGMKKLLIYESNAKKSDSCQFNIERDSIEDPNRNSRSSSASYPNYNNSSVPFEIEDLSALYAHYQIDPKLYPPPDLQLYKAKETSLDLSQRYFHLYNDNLSEQPRNSSRKSRRQGRKQKRFRSDRNRKKFRNKRAEMDDFHSRNMITVRRISCHDILDPQMKMTGYQRDKFESEMMKTERECLLYSYIHRREENMV